MAVQQNKKSPSKRGMHRAHDFLTPPALAVEPTNAAREVATCSRSNHVRGRSKLRSICRVFDGGSVIGPASTPSTGDFIPPMVPHPYISWYALNSGPPRCPLRVVCARPCGRTAQRRLRRRELPGRSAIPWRAATSGACQASSTRSEALPEARRRSPFS